MTSICNYSHPELQITAGLERQGSGTLFPYHPEFYDLTSGLYGPGTIICWQLLILSVILNWSCYEKDEDGHRKPGVSVDLLGVISYPAFAATDALIHAMKMLNIPDRALAIFCLRYPTVILLDGLATFNTTRLDLHDPIPPDIVVLGQRALDLTGPLDVCYMFLGACHLLIVCLLISSCAGRDTFAPTRWAGGLILSIYGYIVLLLWIIHCSLGNLGISMILWFYEIITPILQVFFLVYSGFTLFSSIAMVLNFILAVIKQDKKELLEAAKMLGGWLLLCVFFFVPLVFTYFVNDMKWVPDLGISIKERDQLATLIVGTATLLYTIYEVGRRLTDPERTQEDEVEMQSLAQDVP